MQLQRTLNDIIKNVSETFPVLLLTGARQVGKTTLLKQLAKENRTYVSLDDPKERILAQEDPAMFLQKYRPPVLIDEVQYAPQLFPYIKIEVDERGKNGLFWLTGSQQFSLMKNITESLAGRVGILRLMGLSLHEIEEEYEYKPFLPTNEFKKDTKKELREIYKIIFRGAFPKIVLDKKVNREVFYSSYIQTYLQRDVKDITDINNERDFIKFLRSAAARTGQLINYTDLARDAEISPKTAKNWLSILETSGLVYLLEPYYNNITKRLVKAPKLYFLDTGLCAYLTEWSTPETIESGAMSGAFLETFVISELLKSYWHNGKEAPFYFYRDKDKKEIDLLIKKDNKLYPIEIKKTANPNKDAVKNFETLKNLNVEIGQGALICFYKGKFPISRTVDSISVGLI